MATINFKDFMDAVEDALADNPVHVEPLLEFFASFDLDNGMIVFACLQDVNGNNVNELTNFVFEVKKGDITIISRRGKDGRIEIPIELYRWISAVHGDATNIVIRQIDGNRGTPQDGLPSDAKMTISAAKLAHFEQLAILAHEFIQKSRYIDLQNDYRLQHMMTELEEIGYAPRTDIDLLPR